MGVLTTFHCAIIFIFLLKKMSHSCKSKTTRYHYVFGLSDLPALERIASLSQHLLLGISIKNRFLRIYIYCIQRKQSWKMESTPSLLSTVSSWFDSCYFLCNWWGNQMILEQQLFDNFLFYLMSNKLLFCSRISQRNEFRGSTVAVSDFLSISVSG